jgi:hypothetical protein
MPFVICPRAGVTTRKRESASLGRLAVRIVNALEHTPGVLVHFG